MSRDGVELFAGILSDLQTLRHNLLQMSHHSGGYIDQQDVLLAHLCETAKDSVKEQFLDITVSAEHYLKK